MIKREGRVTALVGALLVYCLATLTVRNPRVFKGWIEAYKYQDLKLNVHQQASPSPTAENQSISDDVPAKRQSFNNKTSTSFSACLMLKEDNHWLSEWLPYHYQTARLRHLLVVEDPSSRTSPKEILDRWKDRINIVQWKEKNFWKNGKKRDPLKAIVHRQLAFYRSCILYFEKKTKTSWLMLTDADEYLRVSHNNSIRGILIEPDTTKEGYLVDFLESIASDRPCLTAARYQVSSQEDDDDKHTTTPSTPHQSEKELLIRQHFNTSNFLTFRWMYHNGKSMNHGKSLINLKKLKKKHVPKQLASVHMAIKRVCPPNPPGSNKKDRASNSIALQHYLGSWEQFSFRKDLRNKNKANNKSRLDRWKVAGRNGIRFRDSSMSSWLNGFVQQVGLPEAERLLKDVGVVQEV